MTSERAAIPPIVEPWSTIWLLLENRDLVRNFEAGVSLFSLLPGMVLVCPKSSWKLSPGSFERLAPGGVNEKNEVAEGLWSILKDYQALRATAVGCGSNMGKFDEAKNVTQGSGIRGLDQPTQSIVPLIR